MSRLYVSELMHCCALATVQAESTLRDAAECVLTTGLESLPVVDASGRFVGLIAQAALIRELLSCGANHTTVAPIVSHHVDSARVTATLDSILPLFRAAGVTMIPIVDEANHPVGLIHRRDVIRYLLEDPAEKPHPGPSTDGSAVGPHFLKERRKTADL
jgi:CBS-domain-containing membrane protein